MYDLPSVPAAKVAVCDDPLPLIDGPDGSIVSVVVTSPLSGVAVNVTLSSFATTILRSSCAGDVVTTPALRHVSASGLNKRMISSWWLLLVRILIVGSFICAVVANVQAATQQLCRKLLFMSHLESSTLDSPEIARQASSVIETPLVDDHAFNSSINRVRSSSDK